MIERHYCAHPLIPRGITHSNASDIWQESAKELYEYCYERDLIDLWVYFVDHWYRSDRWYLWARSSFQSLLPMGKTTMMIEAHWKVLKRNHLYYYHRARLDTLVWVISTKHFPQQMYKWARLIARRIEASDWKRTSLGTGMHLLPDQSILMPILCINLILKHGFVAAQLMHTVAFLCVSIW